MAKGKHGGRGVVIISGSDEMLPKESRTLVDDAFGELNRQTGILESLVERLQDKLTPILHPIASGSGTDEAAAAPVVSPIVNTIQSQTGRLADLAGRLEDVIARIEC